MKPLDVIHIVVRGVEVAQEQVEPYLREQERKTIPSHILFGVNVPVIASVAPLAKESRSLRVRESVTQKKCFNLRVRPTGEAHCLFFCFRPSSKS